MRFLAIIPARGGSKSVPGKNIRELNGRPLIYYTIDAAREVLSDNDICVSTDSPEIIEKVQAYNLKVPFVRPPSLSSDYATTENVIRHALTFLEEARGTQYDYVILLQPTSPLRNGSHLKEAIALIEETSEMIVSVKETNSNPYYVLVEEDEKGFLRLFKESFYTRRQDCPVVYELNGAIYIMKVSELLAKGMKNLKRRKYVMDEIFSVDIDSYLDFDLAEVILKKHIK